MKKITQEIAPDEHKMVSFNVMPLFTNLPLKNIDITLKRLYDCKDTNTQMTSPQI